MRYELTATYNSIFVPKCMTEPQSIHTLTCCRDFPLIKCSYWLEEHKHETRKQIHISVCADLLLTT